MAPQTTRSNYNYISNKSGLYASSTMCLFYLCQNILGMVIGARIYILLAWFILCPNKPRYYVDYVSRSQLNVIDRILSSMMDFNVTMRNPNVRLGIYYHKLKWDVYYEDERIASAYTSPLHGRRKKTIVLKVVYIGH
jgi:hypothetical protein